MSVIPTISIHALREESDYRQADLSITASRFQSTLSVRRATAWILSSALYEPISIHALREESDYSALQNAEKLDISIHALREESDPAFIIIDHRQTGISIHALREESD